MSEAGLRSLAKKAPTSYTCWDEPKKSGGVRHIEAPFENLKSAQRRVAELLSRVQTPAYLMAPVKGRSYVDNGAAHLGARVFRLLDLEDFFPSCTSKRVFWFFNTALQCSDDVAGTLTRLTTLEGRLPQGSPASPLLAYWAYREMWDQIERVCSPAENTLTVYADDITISGSCIRESDIWRIKQLIHRYGHRYSRKKERKLIDRAAPVTGTIVSGEALLLPNRQHKQIKHVRDALEKAPHDHGREKLKRQLRGRLVQQRQILEHQG